MSEKESNSIQCSACDAEMSFETRIYNVAGAAYCEPCAVIYFRTGLKQTNRRIAELEKERDEWKDRACFPGVTAIEDRQKIESQQAKLNQATALLRDTREQAAFLNCAMLCGEKHSQETEARFHRVMDAAATFLNGQPDEPITDALADWIEFFRTVALGDEGNEDSMLHQLQDGKDTQGNQFVPAELRVALHRLLTTMLARDLAQPDSDGAVNSELEAAHKRIKELTGLTFSDRNWHAFKSRAERAEAELEDANKRIAELEAPAKKIGPEFVKKIEDVLDELEGNQPGESKGKQILNFIIESNLVRADEKGVSVWSVNAASQLNAFYGILTEKVKGGE